MRYVHLNDNDVRIAMEKARGGHKSGHTDDLPEVEGEGKALAKDTVKRN
jgi:hypothetical protein